MSFRSRLVGGVVVLSTTMGLGLVTGPAALAAAAPVLLSVSVSTTAVTAPGEVTLSYTATPDSVITQALAGYTDAGGRLHSVQFVEEGTTGHGTLALPDGVRNGLWQLQYVHLANETISRSYVCRSGRDNTGCTEFRDLSAYDVTVTGSTLDATAPLLTSLQVTPTAQPGGSVLTSWDVAESHAVTSALFTFRNNTPEARGHVFGLPSQDPEALASGSITGTVPANAYNGTYELESVLVADSLGNVARYRADGTTVLGTGTEGPTTHALDFSSITVQVTGSTRDVTPPVLDWVAAGGSMPADGSVNLSFTAADPSGLSSVVFGYDAPDASRHNVGMTILGPDTGARPGYQFPQVGDYRLARVTLKDKVGNTIEVSRDGTWTDPLTQATGTHDVQLADADVVVLPEAVAATVRPRPRSAVLTWPQPLPQTLAAISGYEVTVNPGNRVVEVTADKDLQSQSVVVEGLTNATTYTFTVRAVTPSHRGYAASVTAAPVMSSNVVAAGDVNRDGRGDVFAQLPGTDTLRLYRGTGRPGFGPGTEVSGLAGGVIRAGGPVSGEYSVIEVRPGSFFTRHLVGRHGQVVDTTGYGSGWNVRFLDGSSDLTGDKVADVVAVRHNGDAYLYAGDPGGYLAPGRRIATGWSSMQTVFAARDVTGNGTADLLTVDAAGALWVHPGTGKGTFTPRVKVGTGWGGLGALFAGNDLTGDGRVDLGAITMDGTFRVYPGRGQARFGSGIAVSKGWAAYL